jgi:hypothetical protein
LSFLPPSNRFCILAEVLHIPPTYIFSVGNGMFRNPP